MEFVAAPKISSALPPYQELRRALRTKDRFFTAQITPRGSSIAFHRPNSASSLLNVLRKQFTPMPACSCSNLPQKLASTRQSDRSGTIRKGDSTFENFLKLQVPLSLMSVVCFPLASAASDADQLSDKITVESILESVDNFFIRYPFVVAGIAVVWLVIVPLAGEYRKKYKYISAIDAFVKLKDEASYQLLDIRNEQSRNFLDSPDLKSLNKTAVQAEFSQGQEDAFVKKVLNNLRDPTNTAVCILDSFDDNSLQVAELLVKNGFKEAYAIKGGLRGKDGWQAIQETLLPTVVRVYPKKKKPLDDQMNGRVNAAGEASARKQQSSARSSSPYPNYPDMKPPSSPTPSKP